ncbi:Sex-lethal [Intoshia linei]|uniref:Sex-lethal n=1 Tax=Intoshia linei TaxID=1819745 RepID=A0A177BDP2_9BILA|nr:Sex-lethal [Intoshia linei]
MQAIGRGKFREKKKRNNKRGAKENKISNLNLNKNSSNSNKEIQSLNKTNENFLTSLKNEKTNIPLTVEKSINKKDDRVTLQKHSKSLDSVSTEISLTPECKHQSIKHEKMSLNSQNRVNQIKCDNSVSGDECKFNLDKNMEHLSLNSSIVFNKQFDVSNSNSNQTYWSSLCNYTPDMSDAFLHYSYPPNFSNFPMMYYSNLPGLENSQKLSRTNIYIRGLNVDTTDDNLYQMCRKFGNIISTKAIIDHQTKKCKGYGFVDFENPESADRSVKCLKVQGVQVQMAKQQEQDPTNLYIANLPESVDENQLESVLSEIGKVISTRILRNVDGTSRCVGFSRLESHQICENAIDKLNKQPFPGHKKLLTIKFADNCNRKKTPFMYPNYDITSVPNYKPCILDANGNFIMPQYPYNCMPYTFVPYNQNFYTNPNEYTYPMNIYYPSMEESALNIQNDDLLQ